MFIIVFNKNIQWFENFNTVEWDLDIFVYILMFVMVFVEYMWFFLKCSHLKYVPDMNRKQKAFSEFHEMILISRRDGGMQWSRL